MYGESQGNDLAGDSEYIYDESLQVVPKDQYNLFDDLSMLLVIHHFMVITIYNTIPFHGELCVGGGNIVSRQ